MSIYLSMGQPPCNICPSRFEADDILIKNGSTVIPDILANAGGVVVSYYEWVQNNINERWDEDTVMKKLDKVMTAATKELEKNCPGFKGDTRKA